MIEKLPFVPLKIIFNNLSYEDVFNLRVTCKKLKEVIDKCKPTKLNCFFYTRPANVYSFYTNELICYPNSFVINMKIYI